MASKESNFLTRGVLFLTVLILVSVFLIIYPHIWLSWTIAIVAGGYALYQVNKQGRNWWNSRQNKVAKRERLVRVLASLMGLFLVSGMILFLYAFQCEMEESQDKAFLFVNAEYLLRSLVCSLDLFMLDIESNVLDEMRGHQYLKGMISIQAVLSFSCTVAVLISLAYARVKAYYKLHKQTVIDNGHDHLFVFFDMNEQSRLLAKNIRNREGERAVIVIIEKSPVDDEDRGGWDSIVKMFTHREQTFADADELDARVTFTETRLCEIEKDGLTQKDILGEMNLRTVKTLIKELATNKIAAPELHVFFLADNEDENIRAISTLAEDDTINEINEKVKQRFYCHARRSGVNRVVEDIAVKRGLEVQIVDSAHLSIELLKCNDAYQPVRLVEIDKDNPTTVKSEFHSLIVGFDEAGQDALRFLYEFGAFVDSKSTPQKDKRSPFYCTIVDSKINELKGYFHAFTPEVINKKDSDNVFIKPVKADCRSIRFYNLLTPDLCKKLNYIIIAIGNDELGMTCAIRIFNFVRMYRKDMSKLRIFVRSYQADKEYYMQKIADHYNEGYNKDFKNSLKPEEREEYVSSDIIVPFGQKANIYSYDMIIDERLVKEGRRFQEGYAQMRKDSELWDERRQLLMGLKEKRKNDLGETYIAVVPKSERTLSLNNIRSLRRKEAQDIANALHAGTKLYLLRQTQSKDFDWDNFLNRYFNIYDETPHCTGELGNIVYPELSQKENQTILNLARLEHLRWNASHEMLGYKKAHKGLHSCDEQTREHNCLRSWEELDAESMEVRKTEGWNADYKSFDFGVVDITLLLYKDKLKNCND